MADVQEQLDFLLSVDRLISAADEAKRIRDRLLRAGRAIPTDKAPTPKQQVTTIAEPAR
ncbi:MAG: hypothetical protein WCJ35_20545 [Planctomycetota bacterium]